MSVRRMERIRRFLAPDSGEDQMDVDMDFTEKYLSQFESIDRQIIDVLIENGYETKEQLLAFDITEDLPVLPVLNMAQKSMLRKILRQLHESEELETKIYDLKGDDIYSTTSPSIVATNPVVSKRKLEVNPRSSSPKRLRSNPQTTPELNDSLGPKMRQMVSGRKSIRRQYSSSQSESEGEPSRIVEKNGFQLRNRAIDRSYVVRPVKNSVPSADEEEEEEEEDVMAKLSAMNRQYQSMGGRGFSGTARKSIAGKAPAMMMRETATNSVRKSMPGNIKIETPPKPSPKTSSPSTYVPTPTELEVRERLAQKQALGKQKPGRKRR